MSENTKAERSFRLISNHGGSGEADQMIPLRVVEPLLRWAAHEIEGHYAHGSPLQSAYNEIAEHLGLPSAEALAMTERDERGARFFRVLLPPTSHLRRP